MPKSLKKIPKKIDDTIVSSTFEVRFTLSINENEFLGHLLDILKPKYPKFQTTNQGIPAAMWAIDPQFKYFPEYQFSNDEFTILIGKHSMVFEYLSEYKGWDHFCSQLKAVLSEIDKLKKIFHVTERLGLRYINLLGDNAKLEDVLDLKLKIEFDNLEQKNISFRNEIVLDNANVIINIFENGTVTRMNKVSTGLVIDVDVSTTGNLPTVGTLLLPFIEDLHQKEKYVFFNILTQKFVESRNPIY